MIIWTSADPIHCRIYAALGGDAIEDADVIFLLIMGVDAGMAVSAMTMSKKTMMIVMGLKIKKW